jgi:hypothetical protein
MLSRNILAALAVSCLPALAAGCLQTHQLFQEVNGTGGLGAAGSAASGRGGQSGNFGGPGGPPMMRFHPGDPCSADTDCVSGSWCMQGTCTTCGAATDCRQGFNAVARNGCQWCAPPNTCVTNESCGDGQICYPGDQCEPGCSDLTCCHGNQCGDPECGPPDQLDCSVIGCPDGNPCMGTAQAQNCRCDHHQWMCDMSDGANQCEQEHP